LTRAMGTRPPSQGGAGLSTLTNTSLHQTTQTPNPPTNLINIHTPNQTPPPSHPNLQVHEPHPSPQTTTQNRQQQKFTHPLTTPPPHHTTPNTPTPHPPPTPPQHQPKTSILPTPPPHRCWRLARCFHLLFNPRLTGGSFFFGPFFKSLFGLLSRPPFAIWQGPKPLAKFFSPPPLNPLFSPLFFPPLARGGIPPFRVLNSSFRVFFVPICFFSPWFAVFLFLFFFCSPPATPCFFLFLTSLSLRVSVETWPLPCPVLFCRAFEFPLLCLVSSNLLVMDMSPVCCGFLLG